MHYLQHANAAAAIVMNQANHKELQVSIKKYSKWRLTAPKSAFLGSGGALQGGEGEKIIENELICSCRQPPAGICDFSRHLKSANPDFRDVCIDTYFLRL